MFCHEFKHIEFSISHWSSMVQTQRNLSKVSSGLTQDAWIILSNVTSPKKCDATLFKIWGNSFSVKKNASCQVIS